MLGLRMSLSPSLSLSHELKQTLGTQLRLTHSLFYRLRGKEDDFRPKGQCPRCDHRLTPAEIVQGFNRDPNDLSTKCPKCKHRFAPILVNDRTGSTMQMPFYCAIQTVGMLRPELAELSVKDLELQHQAIYRSALYHFHSLKTAFQKIGITYNREPKIGGWKKKVMKFLGKLPDTVIASASAVTIREVRALRREKNIPAYRKGDV